MTPVIKLNDPSPRYMDWLYDASEALLAEGEGFMIYKPGAKGIFGHYHVWTDGKTVYADTPAGEKSCPMPESASALKRWVTDVCFPKLVWENIPVQ